MFYIQLKRNLSILCVLCISALSIAQTAAPEVIHSDVDNYVENFKKNIEDIPTLARELTKPFGTDTKKARAIFLWLAHNVRYDCKKFHNPKRSSIKARSQEELQRKIAEEKEKELARTVKYKKGVCQDYSDLFKAMCDAVGLEAVVIQGDARSFHNPFRSNHNNPHAWNAVKLDGQWHLLDATWGAGYTDPAVKKFTRQVGTGFFMTPPAWFAQTHLPDNPNWQMLEQPLDKKSFATQSVVNFGQQEYPFIDFPKSIDTSNGAEEIRLKFKTAPKFFALATSNGRPIKFTHSKEDGYDVFNFKTRAAGTLIIFGGESQQEMDWLAKYDL